MGAGGESGWGGGGVRAGGGGAHLFAALHSISHPSSVFHIA